MTIDWRNDGFWGRFYGVAPWDEVCVEERKAVSIAYAAAGLLSCLPEDRFIWKRRLEEVESWPRVPDDDDDGAPTP